MPVIVVANPKGGVGKSTVATNLAGALARAGHAVMLGAVDRQQSKLEPVGRFAVEVAAENQLRFVLRAVVYQPEVARGAARCDLVRTD